VDDNHRVIQEVLPLVLHSPGDDQLCHLRLFLHFMQLLATKGYSTLS
jgi:hypothetical protein